MDIYWDVTKSGISRHQSGINRVSVRLMESLSGMLGVSVIPVVWSARKRDFLCIGKGKERLGEGAAESCFITGEIFCETERAGFGAWLKGFKGKRALIFHDAIPLQYPEFTWPHSVSRHPHYMKMLLGFDRLYAVSEHSLGVLIDYLDWLSPQGRPRCERIYLGADFDHSQRGEGLKAGRKRQLVMSGIIEPRKNQTLILDALECLRGEGEAIGIYFVGRVNPHFGAPIVKRMRTMKRAGMPVYYESMVSDERMSALYRESLFSVFPSQAEGCGLPVMESLWTGLPVLASDIPSVKEQGEGGGIDYFKNNNLESLVRHLRRLLKTESSELDTLYERVGGQVLTTWKESGEGLIKLLREPS